MFKSLGTTTETWRGTEPAEVGNLAAVGNIRNLNYPDAQGIVIEVIDCKMVCVSWTLRTQTRKRAHAENKRNQAARRAVVNDTLEVLFRQPQPEYPGDFETVSNGSVGRDAAF